MEFYKLSEYGYEEAALGFSLSYNTTIERAKEIMPKIAFGVPGENKFLESMQIWADITAPRFWWQEFDTYRVGITKQSESTMHTLSKNELSNSNFEEEIDPSYLKLLNYMREKVIAKDMRLATLKNALPEGFVQRRIVNMNYKTFRNIYEQRKNHRLILWKTFCKEFLNLLDHPEFIVKPEIV